MARKLSEIAGHEARLLAVVVALLVVGRARAEEGVKVHTTYAAPATIDNPYVADNALRRPTGCPPQRLRPLRTRRPPRKALPTSRIAIARRRASRGAIRPDTGSVARCRRRSKSANRTSRRRSIRSKRPPASRSFPTPKTMLRTIARRTARRTLRATPRPTSARRRLRLPTGRPADRRSPPSPTPRRRRKLATRRPLRPPNTPIRWARSRR